MAGFRKDSIQSRVREAIKAAGTITIKGLQEVLALEGDEGYARISRACTELKKSGYVEKTGQGTYSFVKEPRGLDRAKVQKRMARIIRIRTNRHDPFTVATLSELAACSRYWAKRYVTFLAKRGFLERVGSQRVGLSRVKAPMYLGVREKLNEEWPAMTACERSRETEERIQKIRTIAIEVARECDANKKTMGKIIEKRRSAISVAEEIIDQR